MTRFARQHRFLVSARFATSVVNVVSTFFGVPEDMIRGPARDQATSRARMICMFVLHGATSMSRPEIGRLFNHRDRATVSAALKTVEAWLVRDPPLKMDLIEIACAVAARVRPAQIDVPTAPPRMLPARSAPPAEENPGESHPPHVR